MRVLLTGASGQLGAYLLDALVARGHEVRAWTGVTEGIRGDLALRPVDLTNADATVRQLAADDPEVVIHAAALSAADAVRRDPERGHALNVSATERLAHWCRARGRRLIFTSTDLVFDGSRPWWRESDLPCAILEYGRTKQAAEPAVLAVPSGLVARLSLLYGRSKCGRPGFFDRARAAMRAGQPQTFFADEYRTPLDYVTAADILARLAASSVTGVLHIAGRERLSRFELMRRAAVALGLDPELVLGNRRDDVALAEPRPADVSLDSTRLNEMFPDGKWPTIEQALAASP